jgi:nitrite reductase/ring-hydroxylating ferredoxin subunit
MRQEPAPDLEASTAQPTAPIPDPPEGSTRRGLLAGVGLAGIAGVLSACDAMSNDAGDSGSGSGGGGGDTGRQPGAGGGDEGGGGGGAQAGALAKTSDVPVGGGTVIEGEKLVITQPTEGDFRCFSAVCPHRGCTVDSVADGVINCPCHGSKFSVEDASVADGPASEPLSRKQIKVQGDSIVLA